MTINKSANLEHQVKTTNSKERLLKIGEILSVWKDSWQFHSEADSREFVRSKLNLSTFSVGINYSVHSRTTWGYHCFVAQSIISIIEFYNNNESLEESSVWIEIVWHWHRIDI